MNSEYRKVPTSADVWAALRARHVSELRVYARQRARGRFVW